MNSSLEIQFCLLVFLGLMLVAVICTLTAMDSDIRKDWKGRDMGAEHQRQIKQDRVFTKKEIYAMRSEAG